MAKAPKTHYRRMIGKAILVVFPLLIVLSIARGYILMLIQAAIDNDDVHRFNQLMDLGISPNSLVLDANDEHVDDSEAVMRYLLSPFSRGYIARESLLSRAAEISPFRHLNIPHFDGVAFRFGWSFLCAFPVAQVGWCSGACDFSVA